MNWLEKIDREHDADIQSNARDVRQHTREALQSLETKFLTVPMLPVFLYSGGKDSSVTLSLGAVAWARAIKKQPTLKKIPFLVVYSNTLYEAPHKRDYLAREVDELRTFAAESDINLIVLESQPRVNESWSGKVVAGSVVNWTRVLGQKAGCSVNWKIRPNERVVKPYEKMAKQLGLKLVKFLGSRRSESNTRAQNLQKYGAQSFEIVEYSGFNYLFPVIDWSTEDIWDYLLFCERDDHSRLPAIKDAFERTAGYYNTLNGNECSASDISNAGGCAGSRDGCWLCMMSDSETLDKNIGENLPHTVPLQQYRIYMLRNDGNVLNRSFVQQSPSQFNDVRATSFSGSYLLDILRIGLTIQRREEERAANEKMLVEKGLHLDPSQALTEPTFTIFRPIDICWIDYNWSIRGLQIEPHAALRAYYDVYHLGKRFDIPSNYVRHESTMESFSDKTGQIFYSDLDLSTSAIETTDNEMSWQFASDQECRVLLEPEVLETWFKDTQLHTAASRWLESGMLIPPKSQLVKIQKQIKWVKNIFDCGLNKAAFAGGPLAE